ncbi:MAG: MipA/OmpV family protein, partial [Enterobacteriaceae bacterium]
MKKYLFSACCLSLLGTGVLAQSAAAAVESPSLGLGVLVTPNPYKGDQDRVFPVPLVNYDSELFYIKGLGAGYYLWNEDNNKLSASLFYDTLHFTPGDSDNNAMKQLNKRHSTMLGGLRYQHQENWGTLRAMAGGDLLNNSNGMLADFTYLYGIDMGRLQVIPGA